MNTDIAAGKIVPTTVHPELMDEDTITVGYRDWRGEPRGKLKKGQLDPAQGD